MEPEEMLLAVDPLHRPRRRGDEGERRDERDEADAPRAEPRADDEPRERNRERDRRERHRRRVVVVVGERDEEVREGEKDERGDDGPIEEV